MILSIDGGDMSVKREIKIYDFCQKCLADLAEAMCLEIMENNGTKWIILPCKDAYGKIFELTIFEK